MDRQTPVAGAPNILFILTDDQPWHTLYRMQTVMARLAGEGTDYTSVAYTIEPLCGPARASLFSGLAPHNHGAISNYRAYEIYRNRGWPQRDLLARVWAAGYTTGYFGKLINGYGEDDSGRWVHPFADKWIALVGGQGLDPYHVNLDGVVRDEGQNHTPYFGGKAEAWIRVRAASTQPWLAWLNFTDPHAPYTAPDAYRHTHDGERYSSPAVEEDSAEELADKSQWTRKVAAHASRSVLQETYEGQMEELELVDVWVGRLLDALTETGQLDNTIIIFTTDNGFMSGEHGGLTKKVLPYDGDMRVPFVIRGPGFAAGAQEQALVSHLDIPATILEAAGATVAPTEIDGRSLLAPPGEAGEAWRKRLLIEHPFMGWRVLRDGPYQYAELPSGEVELYDLLADPHELENIAASNPDLCAELHGRLALLSTTTGDEFRDAEEAG